MRTVRRRVGAPPSPRPSGAVNVPHAVGTRPLKGSAPSAASAAHARRRALTSAEAMGGAGRRDSGCRSGAAARQTPRALVMAGRAPNSFAAPTARLSIRPFAGRRGEAVRLWIRPHRLYRCSTPC